MDEFMPRKASKLSLWKTVPGVTLRLGGILIKCRRDVLFVGPSASLRMGLPCNLCFAARFLAPSRQDPINRLLDDCLAVPSGDLFDVLLADTLADALTDALHALLADALYALLADYLYKLLVLTLQVFLLYALAIPYIKIGNA